MAPPGGADYLALVSTVALLTAVFLLLARIFKLGFLADFLSRTVLVSFLAGVGLQVGIAMLGDMLGLTTHAHNALVNAWQLARALPDTNLPTAAVATLVTAAILLGNRLIPRIPLPFVAVLGSIAASVAFHFAAYGIAVIGPVPGGLPALGLPSVTWSEILALLPVAASCFVTLGILESRWLHSLIRCQAVSLASTSPICACSWAYSLAWMANRSRARTGRLSSAWMPSSSRTRRAIPLGSGLTELCGITTDGIGQLRAVADQSSRTPTNIRAACS
jgi:hypothetical protein